METDDPKIEVTTVEEVAMPLGTAEQSLHRTETPSKFQPQRDPSQKQEVDRPSSGASNTEGARLGSAQLTKSVASIYSRNQS